MRFPKPKVPARHRVIGIDPGTRLTGYGIVEQVGNQLTHVASGSIRLSTLGALSERLYAVHEQLSELIAKYNPDGMAVESVFYAKNVRSSIVLGHARGAVLLTGAKFKLPVFEYSPLEVKSAVVGYGRASKDQIHSMMSHLFPLARELKTALPDTCDALAVAVCHLNTWKTQQKFNAPQSEKTSYTLPQA